MIVVFRVEPFVKGGGRFIAIVLIWKWSYRGETFNSVISKVRYLGGSTLCEQLFLYARIVRTPILQRPLRAMTWIFEFFIN